MPTVITTYDEFLTLEPEWNRLLAGRDTHSVFDTFEWNRLWLKHFQHEYELHCLVLTDSQSRNLETSKPRNIIPLVKTGRKYYVLGGPDRDRSLFLAPPSVEDIKTLCSYLSSSSYTHVEILNLPLRDAWDLKWILEDLSTPHQLTLKKEYTLSPDQFNLALRAGSRELEKKLEKLKAQGNVLYAPISRERLNEYLEFLFTKYESRAVGKSYRSRFLDESYKNWFREMIESEALNARPFALTVNETIIGVEIGFLNNGILSNFATAFDPAWRRFSPGLLRVPLLVQASSGNNINLIRFGPGEMDYKRQFTDNYESRANILILKSPLIRFFYSLKTTLNNIQGGKLSGIFPRFSSIQSERSVPLPARTIFKTLAFSPLALLGLHRIFEKTNESKIRVLCYHKIADSDPHPIALRVARFAKQAKYLKKHFTILPLSRVKELILAGEPFPANNMCLTFDDGYRDNYEFLFPIIKRLNIPIAIFLCGAYVKQGTGDRVEVIANIQQDDSVSSIPSTDNSPAGELSPKPSLDSYPWDQEREACLTPEQIREMLESGLVEFYPHTMTHPILSKVTLDEARKEIVESKQWIENLIQGFRAQGLGYSQANNKSTPSTDNSPAGELSPLPYIPDIFAYPSGNPGVDYTSDHETIAREAGFAMAVSVREYSSQQNPNPFAIERRAVQNEPLPLFLLRISGVIDWMKKIF